MASTRPSLELLMEQDRNLQAAQALQSGFEKADLQLVRNVSEFNTHKLDADDTVDSDDVENKDPAIVAADVAAQISFFRKLKFQYLEQNAKDKYVKSIVSDIDDAPIVTAEDNKELAAINEEKKARLKVAKAKLNEVHNNIRTLGPMVEQDFRKVKEATDKATMLAQKIIDTRLALSRLRQTHPQPRLTVPLADQMLAEQVTQMQNLSDEAQAIQEKIQAVKERSKSGALEVETLRLERTEIEKAVKISKVDDDDRRLVPLYDWYTASLALHRSIHNLEESHSASENELWLTYKIDAAHQITITLIFAPDTRQLAAATVNGLEEMGVDVGDVIDAHVQINDVHGLVAAVLAGARRGS